ncbi:MAG: 7TM domain-containing protein [Candidatus Peregrinibacteria bacterium]
MKNAFLVLSLLVCIGFSPVFAQSSEPQEPSGTSGPVTAVITGPDNIVVGRTIVLDASQTQGLGENTTYRWYRDRSARASDTVEAVYTPEKPGTIVFRLVIRTTISGQEYEVEKQHTVVVFERKIVLIADTSDVTEEKIALHQEQAKEAGVYLLVLRPAEKDGSASEPLATVIGANIDAVAGAQAVVLWTDDPASGLQALMNAADTSGIPFLEKQYIIVITSRSLAVLARTAGGPFAVLKPDSIVLTRKESINPLLTEKDIPAFLEELSKRDIDVRVIDASAVAIRPWNVLSSLVNYMLTHGVSSQTVILLLILPIIATILAFLRQVIGLTTFGLFTPSIVTLSFLALGWQVGVMFLLIILFAGYTTRALVAHFRLLHVPRMAIVICAVSITLLLLLSASAAFGVTYERDTIFILLIMSTLTESFLSLKAEEGWRSAVAGTAQTILASLLCVAVVQWPLLQSFILAYPELILATIFVNIALGRWSGLRLVEYFRFREVLGHLQEE